MFVSIIGYFGALKLKQLILSMTEILENQKKRNIIDKISTLSCYKQPKNGYNKYFQVTHGSTTTTYNLYQNLGILGAFKPISGSF